MSDIKATGSNLDALSIANKTKKLDNPNNALGQDAFLELMISQLKNQDPTAPKDNGEFISQLAQFSSVQSLDKLNTNFSGFSNRFVSNQALQASSMVGRSVMVPASQTVLDANGLITATADLPSGSSNFSIGIYNQGGALIKNIDVDQVGEDQLKLQWNGKEAIVNGKLIPSATDAQAAAPGVYTVKISGVIDGKKTQLDSNLSANVNSVTLGKDGTLTLNLAGAGAVKMDDVKEIF